MDHKLVQISTYVIDNIFSTLKWRARHHVPELATIGTDHINDVVAAFENLIPGPIPLVNAPDILTTKACGYQD
jgi:hypothetical protein